MLKHWAILGYAFGMNLSEPRPNSGAAVRRIFFHIPVYRKAVVVSIDARNWDKRA